MQKPGIDYFETYSPVARLATIRTLLAVGTQLGLKFYHMDVTTAFLHGNLDEEVYLKAPDGITIPEGTVLLLKKSLYGLKQSPKMWNKRFDEFITTLGLRDQMLIIVCTQESLVVLVFIS